MDMLVYEVNNLFRSFTLLTSVVSLGLRSFIFLWNLIDLLMFPLWKPFSERSLSAKVGRFASLAFERTKDSLVGTLGYRTPISSKNSIWFLNSAIISLDSPLRYRYFKERNRIVKILIKHVLTRVLRVLLLLNLVSVVINCVCLFENLVLLYRVI
jgi:hypothetical protein